MENEKNLIVIVDDEDVIGTMFERRFSKLYDVLYYRSAAAMLEDLDSLRPSLMVIDWIMPEMDGVELCCRIRQQHRFDIVPIAFFTGIDPTDENIKTAFQAGAQAFIAKGQSASFLSAQIRTLVESYERLSHYLGQRKVMLSVLKHDMAGLATGVISGIEVLALHPDFEKQELAQQAQSINDAAENLRILFDDLNEVLVTEASDGKKQRQEFSATVFRQDLEEYLKIIQRNVVIADSADMVVSGDRHSLGRSLYYMVRFLDQHIPLEEELTVDMEAEQDTVYLRVTAPVIYRETIERALAEADDWQQTESRHDVLFVQYVRNVLQWHATSLEVITEGAVAGLRFAVPVPGAE
ncbi:MAG: response regulator [Deltaproteobacteria bacterium]|nr:response regulator [Deltaproteobacteria bacterium]